MTLLDIKKLALAQMGEETDEEALEEFGVLLNAYINEAYMQICRHKKQKFAEQSIGFAEGRLPISTLEEEATVILDVTDGQGAKMPFDVLADIIFLADKRSQNCKVQYLYLPQKLVQDADTPDLAEQDCALLADFATYRALSLGNPTRQKRADFFLMRYLTGYSDNKAKQTHLVNKY